MAKVGRGNRFEIDRAALEDLYLVQKLSQQKIAKIYGVHLSTVQLRMREHGIPPRSHVEAGRLMTRTPESNAKRSASHKAIWDERGRVTEEVKLRLQRGDWKARRLECFERDRWRCRDCGVACTNRNGADPKRWIQAHHVVMRRDGGGDELENLLTMCMSCHQRLTRQGK